MEALSILIYDSVINSGTLGARVSPGVSCIGEQEEMQYGFFLPLGGRGLADAITALVSETLVYIDVTVWQALVCKQRWQCGGFVVATAQGALAISSMAALGGAEPSMLTVRVKRTSS